MQDYFNYHRKSFIKDEIPKEAESNFQALYYHGAFALFDLMTKENNEADKFIIEMNQFFYKKIIKLDQKKEADNEKSDNSKRP